jgi:hypothetical protein
MVSREQHLDASESILRDGVILFQRRSARQSPKGDGVNIPQLGRGCGR